MGFMHSLGEAPHLYDVMSKSPRMAIYLFKMTDEIMLSEGPLTPAERENHCRIRIWDKRLFVLLSRSQSDCRNLWGR